MVGRLEEGGIVEVKRINHGIEGIGVRQEAGLVERVDADGGPVDWPRVVERDVMASTYSASFAPGCVTAL